MALDKFFSFITDFKSVSSLIGKAAILAPFLGLLLNIGPPWPTELGVSSLTSLTEVFVLIYIFQFYTPMSKKSLKSHLRLFIILTILGFIIYISLYQYIFETPAGQRIVKGFILQETAQKLITEIHTEDYLLKSASYDPTRIYDKWTVSVMSILLLLSWIFFFVGSVGSIANFVILQQKDAARERQTTVS